MKHRIKDLLHKLLLSRLGDSSASFWMTPLGGLERNTFLAANSEEFPEFDGVDSHASILPQRPPKALEALPCPFCGKRIATRYFGSHTAFCGVEDWPYQRPDDQEINY